MAPTGSSPRCWSGPRDRASAGARPADAVAIGAVHVAAWRSTYPGILPDRFLAGLSVSRQAAYYDAGDPRRHAACSWRSPRARCADRQRAADHRLRHRRPRPHARDPGKRLAEGEVETLYVLDDWRERGVGRRLMRAAAAHLVEMGCKSAFFWVLRDNPSRWFYQRLGGRPVAEAIDPVAGQGVCRRRSSGTRSRSCWRRRRCPPDAASRNRPRRRFLGSHLRLTPRVTGIFRRIRRKSKFPHIARPDRGHCFSLPLVGRAGVGAIRPNQNRLFRWLGANRPDHDRFLSLPRVGSVGWGATAPTATAGNASPIIPRAACSAHSARVEAASSRLDRPTFRLHLQQQAPAAPRLLHHAQRLGLAAERDAQLPAPNACQSQTIRRPGLRQHDLRRQPPFGRIGRPQRRHPRHRRPVPPSQMLRRILIRRRQRAMQDPNGLMKSIPRQHLRPIGLRIGGCAL